MKQYETADKEIVIASSLSQAQSYLSAGRAYLSEHKIKQASKAALADLEYTGEVDNETVGYWFIMPTPFDDMDVIVKSSSKVGVKIEFLEKMLAEGIK